MGAGPVVWGPGCLPELVAHPYPKKKSLGSKLEDLAFSISRDSLPSRYVAERGEMEGREGP